MNRPLNRSVCWLTAIMIQSIGLPAFATPKAAEHENAPVTFGAEAPKPNPAQTTKKAVQTKTKAVSRKSQSHTVAAKHRK